MLLSDLIAPLHLKPLAQDAEVVGLTADSRAVEPQFVFVALDGVKADGAQFIAAAVEQGAVAVVVGEGRVDERVREDAAGAELIEVPNARLALALMSARFYGAQPEIACAVTGTNGKTSVAVFVREIFEFAGLSSASMGTIGTVTSSGKSYGGLTTPDPVSLHADLSRLADEGVSHVCLEASSHGLDQYRLDGVQLQVAGFTNLGRDHMDYHPTIEDYLAAKLRLFSKVLPDEGSVVVDPASPYAEAVLEVVQARGLFVFTTGVGGEELRLLDAVPEGYGQRLHLELLGEPFEVLLPLAGTFQASNALLAAGMAICAGVDPEVAIAALEHLKGASGRLEHVGTTAAGAQVFIDYAHKPDALEHVLVALRPFARGRLICVFGCGGDRDTGKRAIMGEISGRLADLTIVTDDNPRSEDPAAIRQEILAAVPEAIEIGDRGEAIATAVNLLGEGDVLCVAGKGHETGQIVGDEVLPFSDHEAIAAALASAEEFGEEAAQGFEASLEIDLDQALEAELLSDGVLVEGAEELETEPEVVPETVTLDADAELGAAGLEEGSSEPLDTAEKPELPAAEMAEEADITGETLGDLAADAVEEESLPAFDPLRVVELPEGMNAEEAPLWTLPEFLDAVGGDVLGEPNAEITGISIDSRSLCVGDAFFAIAGEAHDGHSFLEKAMEAGASIAVVAQEKLEDLPEGGRYVVVRDVLHAMERLGQRARARMQGRVIAVTGSVGKTGSKEALRLCLEAAGKTHAPVASFNNHWGVPLTLARMPRDTEFGIFEIGMNHAGEITPLVKMVRPHVAIVTTVEPVHMEFFELLEDVAKAKAEIFAGLEPGGSVILNRDNRQHDLLRYLAVVAGVQTIHSFGLKPGADATVTQLALNADCSCLTASILGQEITYKIGAPGEHHVINSLAVLAGVVALGADLALAGLALADMQAPKGRGEQVPLEIGGGAALLLDESYNANPASMEAALKLLGTMPVTEGGRRIAVLGDMREMGVDAAKHHRNLSRCVRANDIDLVYCVGTLMQELWDALPEGKKGANSDDSRGLKKRLVKDVRAGDVIMIKGSLGTRMAPLVEALRKKYSAVVEQNEA